MPLASAIQAKVIQTYQLSQADTGSTNVQIALLTTRINHLTNHLKQHKKDIHTRRGLMKLVSQRRRLMKYLKRKAAPLYWTLIDRLAIRG